MCFAEHLGTFCKLSVYNIHMSLHKEEGLARRNKIVPVGFDLQPPMIVLYLYDHWFEMYAM